MNIYFVNESSLTDLEAWRIAWACDYQARFHYGRSGWRSDVRCSFIPGGASATIPAGGAVMHLLDTADQPGALGYHDEDGNEIAYGRVFVQTTQQAGEQVSEVAAHETLELATDPHINLTAPTGDLKRLYAVEVGDPVQGNGYDLGAPEGRQVGITVCDFTLPSYYDPNTQANRPTSFRGSVKGPFALAAQGYYSFIDLTDVAAGWRQQVGQERTRPVPPDDRLDRRTIPS